MNNALIILDSNRRLHIGDYVQKLKFLKNTIDKYDKIFCVITDTQFLEDNKAINNIEKNIIENVNIMLNMGIDDKVFFVRESFCSNIFHNANKLSNYVYVSNLTKNPYLKREIQQQYENNTKVSNLLSVLNLISAMITFEVQDVYADYEFKAVMELAKNIINEYNLENEKQINLPSFIYNFGGEQFVGLDGNVNISYKFNNVIDIMESDEIIKIKVKSIFTDPNHIKITDKGDPYNNPLFTYVRRFCDDDAVGKYFGLGSVKELESQYQSGGIGDAKIKEMFYESLVKILLPLKQRISEQSIKNRILENTQSANGFSKKI